MRQLDGKTAIVTGATRGIGRAIAERFANEGAKVVVCGRDSRAGEKLEESVRDHGAELRFVRADVRSEAENRLLVERALEWNGRLDLLVANAGMLGLGSVTSVTTDLWHETIDTNLHSLFYLLRAALPPMRKRGGSIVVTGSIAADKGFPNHAAYCASKGAVRSLVRQVAVDYAPEIRINLLEPGPVDTGLYRSSAVAFPDPETVLDRVPGSLPMGRIAKPEEIASKALFLVSEEASWMTGAVLRVDGGASAAG